MPKQNGFGRLSQLHRRLLDRNFWDPKSPRGQRQLDFASEGLLHSDGASKWNRATFLLQLSSIEMS